MTEERVLTWVADPRCDTADGVSRQELLDLIAASLPALLGIDSVA